MIRDKVRMPATIKQPFVVSARAMQGRVLHRPAEAQTLWANGRLLGVTARTMCNRDLMSVIPHMDAPDCFDICDSCLLADYPTSCVYRLFGVDGSLLYVGCTVSLWTRLSGHAKSPWWPLVARVEYEMYPDQDQALHAEKVAILNDAPRYNRDLTDRARHPARRPARFAHLIASTRVGAP